MQIVGVVQQVMQGHKVVIIGVSQQLTDSETSEELGSMQPSAGLEDGEASDPPAKPTFDFPFDIDAFDIRADQVRAVANRTYEQLVGVHYTTTKSNHVLNEGRRASPALARWCPSDSLERCLTAAEERDRELERLRAKLEGTRRHQS